MGDFRCPPRSLSTSAEPSIGAIQPAESGSQRGRAISGDLRWGVLKDVALTIKRYAEVWAGTRESVIIQPCESMRRQIARTATYLNSIMDGSSPESVMTALNTPWTLSFKEPGISVTLRVLSLPTKPTFLALPST